MKQRPRRLQQRLHSPLSDMTGRRVFGLGEMIEDLSREHYQSAKRRTSRMGFASDSSFESGPVEGVYIISVAARILEMHPQTLRKYERAGLVTPSRTVGMLRLYSEEDIVRLRLIKHLVGDLGLNLAGVQLTLDLFNHMLKIRVRLRSVKTDQLKGFLEQTLEDMFELLHAHSK